MMQLDRIGDPAEQAVDRTLVEAQLNLSSGENQPLVDQYIASATDDVEVDTDLSLIDQTWRLTLDRFPNIQYRDISQRGNVQTIFLPRGPVKSIDTFTYVDTDGVTQTMVEGTDYEITNTGKIARIIPAEGTSFPATLDQNEVVVIEYVAGYGADDTSVPDWAATAIMLKVTELYEGCDNSMAYESKITKHKVLWIITLTMLL